VSAASRIGKQCSKPDANIITSSGVVKKRLRTNAGAFVAVNIGEQRLITDGGVLVANCIVEQCLDTHAHVPHSAGDVKERIVAHCCVLPTTDAGRVWTPCFERRRERKGAERDCQDKKAAAQMRAAHGSYYCF